MNKKAFQNFLDKMMPSQMKDHTFYVFDFHWDGVKLKCSSCDLQVRFASNLQKSVDECIKNRNIFRLCFEDGDFHLIDELWFNEANLVLSKIDEGMAPQIITDNACLNRKMNKACK